MDTIFALSTPRGKSGVAVIRVSGSLAFDVCRSLTGGLPSPRTAALRTLRDRDGKFLDEGLILLFPGQKSFTGEPVVEFQIHGSIAVIDAVLTEIGSRPGIRLAEPGEFTRRALENERLDLAQVEGLSDLLDAETEAQREQALRGLSGKVKERCDFWRSALVRVLALLETTIDFADEEVPDDVFDDVCHLLDEVIADLEREIKGVDIAERVRDGFEVAIVGPPNAGKSTLLNSIASRQAAIVSETAGTTRDVIEVRMDLDGIPVTFLDTAGLRDTEDSVESLGIELAKTRARAADIRVFLVEGEWTSDIVPQPDDITVLAKGDLRPAEVGTISGLTGKGVGGLLEDVRGVLQDRMSGIGVSTRLRQKMAMVQGVESLYVARDRINRVDISSEVMSEDIRFALGRLDFLTGRVGVEDVLDEIFSTFCLGK